MAAGGLVIDRVKILVFFAKKKEKGSYFSKLGNTLFDQKSPFHSVKKLHRGDQETDRHTHGYHDL